MNQFKQALLENHLAFLKTHRGSIRQGGDTIFIESDRPEFTYALLGQKSRLAELPESTHSVQLLPWSEITPDDLKNAGFSPTIGLSYMTLENTAPKWRVREDIVVERVSSQTKMNEFSEVQNRGFNETQEGYENWRAWLKAANDRNLSNKDQRFYIGSLEGRAVGTSLTVRHGRSIGIYGVATLAEYRKQGISTSVMHQAVIDARQAGAEIITLQVKQDSYVEDFYRHLGFIRAFTTGMYRRNSSR